MKTNFFPLAILTLLYVGFLIFVSSSEMLLPERIACHFGASGAADGWMPRSAYVSSIVIFGMLFPLLMPVLGLIQFIIPDRMMNLPNRDYWLAPERRDETRTRLYRPSLWFACLSMGFVIGIHYSVIDANRQIPAHLSTRLLIGFTVCFMVGIVIVMTGMILPFMQTQNSSLSD